MRAIAAIGILIAACLAWGAFNNYSTASSLRSQISNQTGVEKFVGQGMGLNNIDNLRIQQFDANGMKCAVGACIIGVVSLVMASRSKSQSPTLIIGKTVDTTAAIPDKAGPSRRSWGRIVLWASPAALILLLLTFPAGRIGIAVVLQMFSNLLSGVPNSPPTASPP
jgi:hypothetical protein